MKLKITVYFFIIVIYYLTSMCSSQNNVKRHDRVVHKKLKFLECTIAYDEYRSLYVAIPKGAKVQQFKNEGMCEYRFVYRDSSIYYISSDVWFGSRLNIQNRHVSGHTGYHKESLKDTIRIGGKTPRGKYWAENIIGNYTVGYLNASEKKKDEFDMIEKSITLE